MARNYANMSTSRWRPESGYSRLGRDAQWAHYMLTTQPDISAAGVLALNVKRWASRAAGTTRDDVIAALQELQAAGLVLYDTQTEELLVRGFIRDDGGYNNRKRRGVIERAVRDVESTLLRRALLDELVELGLPTEWVGLPGPGGERVHASQESPRLPVVEVPDQHPPKEAFPQVDSLSDSPSDALPDSPSRSDGVVVTQAVVVRPQPTTRNPQPFPPSAAPAVPAAAETQPDGLFDSPPPTVDPEAEKREAQNRAYGLARWWINLRQQQDTPVIAGGKHGPLHPVRALIENFTPVYSDDEIKFALQELDQGLPTKSALDTFLARHRKWRMNQQQPPGYQPAYQPRSTAPLADRRIPPPESAQVRKARTWLEMGEQIRAMNGVTQ